MAMVRFARTLCNLLQSGVPLISSLKIVRNIVDNNLIADDIDKTMEKIQEGNSIAFPLGKSEWFKPVAFQMISVGEQSE
jgi:type II secretory pathway component PulF